MLEFDLVKDLTDRTPFGEMAQFDHQVLLQRLVVVLGLALQRSVDVVRDVTDQDVRHAYIMLATADRGKEEIAVADSPNRSPNAPSACAPRSNEYAMETAGCSSV